MAPGSALPSTTPRATSSTAAAASRSSRAAPAAGRRPPARVTDALGEPPLDGRRPAARGQPVEGAQLADAHGQEPRRARLAALEHRRRPGLAAQLAHRAIRGQRAVEAPIDLGQTGVRSASSLGMGTQARRLARPRAGRRRHGSASGVSSSIGGRGGADGTWTGARVAVRAAIGCDAGRRTQRARAIGRPSLPPPPRRRGAPAGLARCRDGAPALSAARAPGRR